MSNSVADYERKIIQIRQEIKDEEIHHKKKLDNLRTELSVAKSQQNMILGGIDAEKILNAEHVIYVRGLFSKAGEDRTWAISKAVELILDGGKGLRHEYVGTKNYAHFSGQGITCSYGMGPTHGSVCFEIGLTKEARKREEESPLAEEEIDAAIYYLRNLEKIQDAREMAKTA